MRPSKTETRGLISPEAKQDFLRALARECLHVRRDADGLTRA